MNGKIIIKKPTICTCFIKINGESKPLHSFKTKDELELPFGVYKVNVGIEFSDTGNIGMDGGHIQWSDIEWAWEKDKEITIDASITTIKIKRKWHWFKHITAEATMDKQ
ncbi:MAG: hypothetical protein J1F66_02510 [Clostridiales bacterium]|nr:hypothetical protein [Clostridiales bacterium]